MKKSELRHMIKEELNELAGIKIKGHTYTKVKPNMFVGPTGILGPDDALISWKNLKELLLMAKQNGWG